MTDTVGDTESISLSHWAVEADMRVRFGIVFEPAWNRIEEG